MIFTTLMLITIERHIISMLLITLIAIAISLFFAFAPCHFRALPRFRFHARRRRHASHSPPPTPFHAASDIDAIVFH
jgi:hypothetical protein